MFSIGCSGHPRSGQPRSRPPTDLEVQCIVKVLQALHSRVLEGLCEAGASRMNLATQLVAHAYLQMNSEWAAPLRPMVQRQAYTDAR